MGTPQFLIKFAKQFNTDRNPRILNTDLMNIPILQMGEKKIINVDWFPIIFSLNIFQFHHPKKNEQQILGGTNPKAWVW